MVLQEYIQTELDEFILYHQNYANRIIHVLTGIVYMTCLNVLIYRGKFLIVYFIILFLTFPYIIISIISVFIIFCTSYFVLKYKINPYVLLIVFAVCCFIVPEISHYLTNEETVINIRSSPIKIITNIFYFLPFSIFSMTKN